MGRYNPDGGTEMALNRLAKDDTSVTSGGCPALYGTDDPKRMVAQVKKLDDAEMAEVLDLLDDETVGSIPTETVFRGVAKYVTEHGNDELAARIEAFLREQGI